MPLCMWRHSSVRVCVGEDVRPTFVILPCFLAGLRLKVRVLEQFMVPGIFADKELLAKSEDAANDSG